MNRLKVLKYIRKDKIKMYLNARNDKIKIDVRVFDKCIRSLKNQWF